MKYYLPLSCLILKNSDAQSPPHIATFFLQHSSSPLAPCPWSSLTPYTYPVCLLRTFSLLGCASTFFHPLGSSSGFPASSRFSLTHFCLGSWPWFTCSVWIFHSLLPPHVSKLWMQMLSLLLLNYWATQKPHQLFWPTYKGNESGKIHYFSQVHSFCGPISTFIPYFKAESALKSIYNIEV